MELEALHLKVRGQFALVGYEKGSRTTINLTPTGQKQRGLLALLAYSSNRTLSRHWVRQHLWSDQIPTGKALLDSIDCNLSSYLNNKLPNFIELDTSGMQLGSDTKEILSDLASWYRCTNDRGNMTLPCNDQFAPMMQHFISQNGQRSARLRSLICRNCSRRFGW